MVISANDNHQVEVDLPLFYCFGSVASLEIVDILS